jgi:hypothetical protein
MKERGINSTPIHLLTVYCRAPLCPVSSRSRPSPLISQDNSLNNRDKWNFGYQVINTQGSPPQNVVVGSVVESGFKSVEGGATNVVWPGGTTKIPQDTVRADPKNLSVGWVIDTSWTTPVLAQELRMYAQQAIDEINDNRFMLPNTHLTLEMDSRVNGNDKTIEAYNSIEARAKAAGRPLAMVLAASSSHMATIYSPQANVTVTQRSTGVPIVGYDTGAGVLSDSKKFPNFVRLYPPVSETQHACTVTTSSAPPQPWHAATFALLFSVTRCFVPHAP